MVATHVWLGDRPLIFYSGGVDTPVRYIHTDNLDTLRIMTNGATTVGWVWQSGPFGNGLSTAIKFGSDFNLRMPGQYYDAEDGYIYNMNRDYDAGTGRYIESDPIGLEGGINTYAYALNNPVRYFDSEGLDVWIGGPAFSPHENINVGTPNNVLGSYTFGVDPSNAFTLPYGLTGTVYRDFRDTSPVSKSLYLKTTPEQDAFALRLLNGLLGSTAPYGGVNCITFSHTEFNFLKDYFQSGSQADSNAN